MLESPIERIDLHCHSLCSDGLLAPGELVALAAQRGVRLLALTDHDSLDGCEQAQRACQLHGVRFVAGVELTCGWGEHEIHVIGLNVDRHDGALQTHCRRVQQLRRVRIRRIAERLTQLRLPGQSLAAEALQHSCPTRTHLARALCAHGWAGNLQEAFERYLRHGRPAYAAAEWPHLATAVQRIRAAGGLAVLAHPHHYRLSGRELTELAGQFKAADGQGIEVNMAGMSPVSVAAAARLARRFDLVGSTGSDFHQPGQPWRPLGCFAKLPDGVTSVTSRLPGVEAVFGGDRQRDERPGR